MVQHKDLTDDQLHEPKGASTAAAGTVLTANGDGTTSWKQASSGGSSSGDISSLYGHLYPGVLQCPLKNIGLGAYAAQYLLYNSKEKKITIDPGVRILIPNGVDDSTGENKFIDYTVQTSYEQSEPSIDFTKKNYVFLKLNSSSNPTSFTFMVIPSDSFGTLTDQYHYIGTSNSFGKYQAGIGLQNSFSSIPAWVIGYFYDPAGGTDYSTLSGMYPIKLNNAPSFE